MISRFQVRYHAEMLSPEIRMLERGRFVQIEKENDGLIFYCVESTGRTSGWRYPTGNWEILNWTARKRSGWKDGGVIHRR